MNNKINYQRELEKIIAKEKGNRPTLLLHSCCAPCSSYVLEYLATKFAIDILFYNPNIAPTEEHDRRREELVRMTSEMGFQGGIFRPEYDQNEFLQVVAGLENEPEGGARCAKCFHQRMKKTADMATHGGYDYFATTLTISPHKNAQLINSIGADIAQNMGVDYLFSDFKKLGGYKRSLELSEVYGLYRQDYCGCRFSMR